MSRSAQRYQKPYIHRLAKLKLNEREWDKWEANIPEIEEIGIEEFFDNQELKELNYWGKYDK